MKALRLLLMPFAFPLIVFSQSPILPQEPPFIEINGTAELEIVPNELYVSILLKERIDGKDKITVPELEDKMKSGLKNLKIDMTQLSLADANADYLNRRWRSKEVISQKEYLLKLEDSNSLSKVFQMLDEINIQDAWISRVHHTKMDSLKKEVRINAIKAAKDKSDYLLKAIQQQTGKALIVRENDWGYPQPMYKNVNMSASYMDAAESGMAEPEVDFRKIKISSSVYVKFEIK
jgi:hypothetical protein